MSTRKHERAIGRAAQPNGAAPDELMQLKAWQYEAAVQAQMWTQRAQQLHAAIVEREGQAKPLVLQPAPPEPAS